MHRRMMDRRMMSRRRDYGYGRRTSNDYGYSEYDSRRGDRAYSEHDMARTRMGYESGRQSDMGRMDYNSDMRRGRGRDGHYPMGQGSTYYPIEAMGTFNGYWGVPEEDSTRGGRRDYGYDYNYDMRGSRDYRYDYAGDYGENLTMGEMEHWRKKLDKEVGDEQSKHFFKKENVEQKAKQLGIEMKHFNADELALAAYMLYSDYCKSLKPFVGTNMDVFIKMGEEFLTDPDSAVKGGEKLALYFDIVSGEED